MNETSPHEFAQVTPKTNTPDNLMPLMGMLMEIQKDIGGIQKDLENLNDTVKGHTEKVDGLRLQAAYIKGGLAVTIVVIGLFGWFISNLVDGKLNAVLETIASIKP